MKPINILIFIAIPILALLYVSAMIYRAIKETNSIPKDEEDLFV